MCYVIMLFRINRAMLVFPPYQTADAHKFSFSEDDLSKIYKPLGCPILSPLNHLIRNLYYQMACPLTVLTGHGRKLKFS